MRLWKLVGLAGLVGVAAAGGVMVARRRRTWHEPEPEELRQRLHDRLASSTAAG